MEKLREFVNRNKRSNLRIFKILFEEKNTKITDRYSSNLRLISISILKTFREKIS
jgi:hypothetical protein